MKNSVFWWSTVSAYLLLTFIHYLKCTFVLQDGGSTYCEHTLSASVRPKFACETIASSCVFCVCVCVSVSVRGFSYRSRSCSWGLCVHRCGCADRPLRRRRSKSRKCKYWVWLQILKDTLIAMTLLHFLSPNFFIYHNSHFHIIIVQYFG